MKKYQATLVLKIERVVDESEIVDIVAYINDLITKSRHPTQHVVDLEKHPLGKLWAPLIVVSTEEI